jgi:4-hydroxy-tetrahydrodipicolinate synthase
LAIGTVLDKKPVWTWGNAMQVRPTGVIPPMTTPFRKDGEIDFKLVAPQVDWLIGAGSNGRSSAASSCAT